MGERSTAGSICDTCPVEVNNKVHKNRGTAKHPRQNQTVKHQKWQGIYIYSADQPLC